MILCALRRQPADPLTTLQKNSRQEYLAAIKFKHHPSLAKLALQTVIYIDACIN
jgi:hypothetical protein